MNEIQCSEKIEIWRAVLYDGTMESLEEMAKNLNIGLHEYHFNIKTKEIRILTRGEIYLPGNYYRYKIEDLK